MLKQRFRCVHVPTTLIRTTAILSCQGAVSFFSVPTSPVLLTTRCGCIIPDGRDGYQHLGICFHLRDRASNFRGRAFRWVGRATICKADRSAGNAGLIVDVQPGLKPCR